jgi:hypothetical protein
VSHIVAEKIGYLDAFLNMLTSLASDDEQKIADVMMHIRRFHKQEIDDLDVWVKNHLMQQQAVEIARMSNSHVG